MSVTLAVSLMLLFHSLTLTVLADQELTYDQQLLSHHLDKRQVGEDFCRVPGKLEYGSYKPHARRCPPGVNSDECQLVPNARVTVGWVLRYGCSLGYEPNSTRVASICLNWPGGARWLPNLPQCKESSYSSRFLPNKNVCGKPFRQFQRGKREVDGRVSKRGAWPWMVVFGHNKTSNSRDGVHWFCAGVLVTNRHVLTAANCVAPHKKRPNFIARLDDLNLVESEYDGSYPIDIPIEGRKNIIVHPGFQKDVVFSHNIAIVKLKNNVQISDFVRPICLPTPDFKKRSFTGATVYMVSWGQTDDDRELNPRRKPRFEPVLHEINAKVIDHDVCNNNYRSYQQSDTPIIISDKMVCAQVEVNRSCQGDAGSPLVLQYKDNYYLLGIVATKFGCFDDEMFPRVFTKLSEYMDWIISTLSP